jgi:ferric-dicitrate binding protein FerR (iron transport regulator)
VKKKIRNSAKDIHTAWERYLNHQSSDDDLFTISDSLNGEDRALFDRISEREWELSEDAKLRDTEDIRNQYREEAKKLIRKYEKPKIADTSQSLGKHRRLRKYFYAAASVVILAMLIPVGYLLFNGKEQQPDIRYITISSEMGEIKDFVLPDSTKISLNAGSIVKYPSVFSGEKRMVEMSGEVLFDVVSNPAKPFVVLTDGMEIKVLGTVFDVKAYKEDATALVSVVSGKVSVDVKDGPVLLGKDEQLRYDKSIMAKEKLTIDAEKYLLWKSGTLYFHRTPIQEVVNMLNRHYKANIALQDGTYFNLISGEHDNKSLESVLTSICYSTNLKYKKQGGKIVLYK